MTQRPATLGELKASGYPDRTVKEEIEQNLIKRLREKTPLFPGIHGYDDTVLPQVVNALLAHHDIVFLGEKGQAKSRLMRALAAFLDEEIPILAGSEVNDHPYHPISFHGKRLVREKGDAAPIEWIGRERRYIERLAPGTKISDLLGDLDPAKIAAGHSLATEEALHFGLLPRAHRGIFALNELPDLEYLVQVALFNALEERDLQIRGFPLRFPLDVLLVFTANPDDYTRSGKIVSQLKDRIGSQIRTHYPPDRATAIAITRQEARALPEDLRVVVPDFMEAINEQITLEARRLPAINQKAGVSARLSIADFEVLVANARRRALLLGEEEAVPRISDLPYLFASASGKMELDPFQEETVDEFSLFCKIVDRAVGQVFREAVERHELELQTPKLLGETPLRISDHLPSRAYKEIIAKLPCLWEPVRQLAGKSSEAYQAACVEFLLEGLALNGHLSRRREGRLLQYQAPKRAPSP